VFFFGLSRGFFLGGGLGGGGGGGSLWELSCCICQLSFLNSSLLKLFCFLISAREAMTSHVTSTSPTSEQRNREQMTYRYKITLHPALVTPSKFSSITRV